MSVVKTKEELAKLVARLIYDSLEAADPDAMLFGDPTGTGSDSSVIVDGTFDFYKVANFVLEGLEKHDLSLL